MNAARRPVPDGYGPWLAELKIRIRGARQRAVLAANAELIGLYHMLGREILERQERGGWGAKVVHRLASDLRQEFPEMRGLSARNLLYMRDFAQACREGKLVQQTAAQLPWFHVVVLLTKLDDARERAWYAEAAIAAGWSRSVLVAQIQSRAHARQGAAITNFGTRLPPREAGLAQEILKDPYHFDFLGLGEEAHEPARRAVVRRGDAPPPTHAMACKARFAPRAAHTPPNAAARWR